MNLAPVEQYFADYLSVLETREWHCNKDGNYTYSCDPLWKPEIIRQLGNGVEDLRNPDKNSAVGKLATSLGLDMSDKDDLGLWSSFCEFGIPIPFNLIVAGTVNMDETTHGFSRKVIDRALSFDFGEFFPNDFDQFFNPQTVPVTLIYPVWSNGNNGSALQTTFDSDGEQSVDFLGAVNGALDETPFKLAYRALNELLLSVIAAQPADEAALRAVWDDFVMTKVLPRIEGDVDKLAVANRSGDDQGSTSVLDELYSVLSERLEPVWEGEIRPDLYREKLIGDDKTIKIPCRSKAKLDWMKRRLESATFTSFWP